MKITRNDKTLGHAVTFYIRPGNHFAVMTVAVAIIFPMPPVFGNMRSLVFNGAIFSLS